MDEDRCHSAIGPEEVKLAAAEQIESQEHDQIGIEFRRQDRPDRLNAGKRNQ